MVDLGNQVVIALGTWRSRAVVKDQDRGDRARGRSAQHAANGSANANSAKENRRGSRASQEKNIPRG